MLVPNCVWTWGPTCVCIWVIWVNQKKKKCRFCPQSLWKRIPVCVCMRLTCINPSKTWISDLKESDWLWSAHGRADGFGSTNRLMILRNPIDSEKMSFLPPNFVETSACLCLNVIVLYQPIRYGLTNFNESDWMLRARASPGLYQPIRLAVASPG